MKLPYDTVSIACDPPGEVQVFLPNHDAPEASEDALAGAALDVPTGTPPLADLARGRRSAIILIACRTRRTGSRVFVPLIVKQLNEAGIPDARISICTATGTHDNYRPEDAPLLVGGEIAERVRMVGHDCHTPAALADVGTTSRGNRVLLSRAYLEADVKIACGRVTHHYFAGFTAGRKAILPGVSGFETIFFNHRLAMQQDGELRLHPEARNGRLDTNPVHLDMLEGARLAPPDFTLATVLNTANRLTHVFAGEMEAAHRAAVAIVRARDAPAAAAPADLLIVSAGGAPLDVNAVQALKGLLNSFEAVRPGGAVVFVAACPEGAPEWLLAGAAIRDRGELIARLAAGEIRQGHNALWIRRAREHAHVVMVTELRPADVARLGFHQAPTVAEALALAARLAGPPRVTHVVPFGNVTVLRAGIGGPP